MAAYSKPRQKNAGNVPSQKWATWVLATGYEIIVPSPDPVARWVLPAFFEVVALLHLVGLWLRSSPLAAAAYDEP
jgi:hypothetical protein